MKRIDWNYIMIYVSFIVFAVFWCWAMWPEQVEPPPPLVGYSQDVWREGDTLYVVREGDTIKLDISKLK